MKQYAKAKAFYEEYGHLSVSAKYTKEHGDSLVHSEYITSDGTKLGRWACRMRAEYAKGLLPKHQMDLLNEIGMNWDNIETVRAEQFWEDMYLVAQKHFVSHGNLKVGAQYVTEDGVKLGQWLAQQRRIRRGTLKHSIESNEDRIGRLDALGMVWENKIITWDE